MTTATQVAQSEIIGAPYPAAPSTQSTSDSLKVFLLMSDKEKFRDKAFLGLRLRNWVMLGWIYSMFYMGRNNLTVVKGAVQAQLSLSKAEMSNILWAAFWAYAFGVILNGFITTRIGSKRALLIGAAGVAFSSLLMAISFARGVMSGQLFCALWLANMYFQSFGAVTVISLNAPWFHHEERGRLGGFMGVFISSGYFWATTVGSILIRFLPLYWIFLAPALMVGIVGLLVWRLVYDNPSSAGFGELDLGKTAQIEGETQRMNEIFRLFGQVLKKREIRDICVSEFCTGVVRQGMMYYFAEYLAEVYGLTRDKSLFWWTGVGFMMSGITGAFLCDKLSGTYFNHRRAPVAFIFYLAQVVMLILLGFAPGIGSAYGQGLAIFLLALTSLFIFGVHGILSATSSLDFGGKKAVGMVVSLVDGVQYCGGGLAIWAVGHILHTRGWDGTGLSQHPTRAWYWVAPLVLAALCGAARIHRLWHTTPHGEQKTT